MIGISKVIIVDARKATDPFGLMMVKTIADIEQNTTEAC
jgi:hypothetical protein